MFNKEKMRLIISGKKEYIENISKQLVRKIPSTRGRMDVVKDTTKLPKFDFHEDTEFAQIQTDVNLSKLFGKKK